jgi:hypothetical protein
LCGRSSLSYDPEALPGLGVTNGEIDHYNGKQ